MVKPPCSNHDHRLSTPIRKFPATSRPSVRDPGFASKRAPRTWAPGERRRKSYLPLVTFVLPGCDSVHPPSSLMSDYELGTVPMHFIHHRALCSLYLPSGLTVYSCCGCRWQMDIHPGREQKGEAAFNAHCCEDTPKTRHLLQPAKKVEAASARSPRLACH
jgi:hypothetical protein